MQRQLVFLFLIYFNFQVYCFSQGNGTDGPLNVTSGTTTINTTTTPVSGINIVGNTVNVGATTGFLVGNQVLVMQMAGTDAGSYDELTITSLTGTSLTFSSPISVPYTTSGINMAQVIKIPQYTTVNVSAGATLTAPAWNGSTGGVLIYYASGAVTVGGTVTMTGRGFTGGTGGSGNGASALGTLGAGGGSPGANGANASPVGGSIGGTSSAGTGGNGGKGSPLITPNAGTTGNGVGGGGSGIAGTNMSSGITNLVMGGGGGGGQGGQGGQGGGGGGGGGAASTAFLGAPGSNGNNGTAGTASTGVGGLGGTGGGIIFMRIASMSGNGTILSNGSTGSNGTGTGGNGGNGGKGGDGGGGLVLTNSGGGGGGGVGGQGGTGPGGGGGGGAGTIVVLAGNPKAWTGSVTNIAGSGGSGGAAGTSGTSGAGGSGGGTLLIGANGANGGGGAGVPAGITGPSGATNVAGQPPIVLSTTLISFKGNVVDNKVINLVWQTSSEKNNATFIVYKSLDGINYKELGTVTGAGNSSTLLSYSLQDLNPGNGTNYYKLVQVDFNGNQSFSKVITVYFELNDYKLIIYPNPVGDDKMVHFQLNESNLTSTETIEIAVLNSLGQTVHQEAKTISGSYEYTLDFNHLAAGVYYLNLTSESRIYGNEKIIVR